MRIQVNSGILSGKGPEGWDEYFEKPGMPTKGSKNHGIIIENASWVVIENVKNDYGLFSCT